MILGCPPQNQINPERMKIFLCGNSKGCLILWEQLLNDSLDVSRKGRTATSRKDGGRGTRCTLHPKQLKIRIKYIFETLNIRQAGTVTPEKWWTSKVSHTVARASLLPRWFPGHGTRKGNSGGTQRPLLFEKIELRFWGGQDSWHLQCAVPQRQELHRESELQGTPWVFSWVLAGELRKTS